jgi:hypothetical protein
MVYGYLEIHLYSYEKYTDVKWWLNGKNIKFRAEDTLSGVIFIRYIQSQRIFILSFVPNVASVSGVSILDCPYGFL